jgi:hypothetical protein
MGMSTNHVLNVWQSTIFQWKYFLNGKYYKILMQLQNNGMLQEGMTINEYGIQGCHFGIQ